MTILINYLMLQLESNFYETTFTYVSMKDDMQRWVRIVNRKQKYLSQNEYSCCTEVYLNANGIFAFFIPPHVQLTVLQVF